MNNLLARLTGRKRKSMAINNQKQTNGKANGHVDVDEDVEYKDLPKLEDLIAKYGDSSNTTWVEEKFSVWRHPPTGAAIGYAYSNDDYCIIWGNPLCESEQYNEVVDAFLRWLEKQGKKPIWSCCNREMERILTQEKEWRAVMCVQEDALDPTKVEPEKNKEVRKHIRAAEKKGVRIVEEPGEPSDEVKKEIDEVIEQWKANRKGVQVHTTNVEPWRDFEHRRYFYARDQEGNGKVVGFLFIAKVADGWAIKDSIQSPDAPKNLTEWLITTAIHSLANKDEHYLSFGPTPAPSLEPTDNVTSNGMRFLSKTYGGIEKAFLGNKREFRRKFEVEGEPIFVCFPKHGLGRHGINALMKVLTD